MFCCCCCFCCCWVTRRLICQARPDVAVFPLGLNLKPTSERAACSTFSIVLHLRQRPVALLQELLHAWWLQSSPTSPVCLNEGCYILATIFPCINRWMRPKKVSKSGWSKVKLVMSSNRNNTGFDIVCAYKHKAERFHLPFPSACKTFCPPWGFNTLHQFDKSGFNTVCCNETSMEIWCNPVKKPGRLKTFHHLPIMYCKPEVVCSVPFTEDSTFSLVFTASCPNTASRRISCVVVSSFCLGSDRGREVVLSVVVSAGGMNTWCG